MRIGVLGGTGPAGRGLAARLAAAGHDVVLGSRDPDRAVAAAEALGAAWPGHALAVRGTGNAEAAEAELVVLATPWEAAAATVRDCVDRLDGTPLLCMANALTRTDGEFQPLVPPRGSVAAGVQAAVPAARVVAGCHHLPAKDLADLDHALDVDVLLASDHDHAKEAVADVLAGIDGLRPLDAGSLSSAAAIEAFTAVILQLNARYKTRASLKITGL